MQNNGTRGTSSFLLLLRAQTPALGQARKCSFTGCTGAFLELSNGGDSPSGSLMLFYRAVLPPVASREGSRSLLSLGALCQRLLKGATTKVSPGDQTTYERADSSIHPILEEM